MYPNFVLCSCTIMFAPESNQGTFHGGGCLFPAWARAVQLCASRQPYMSAPWLHPIPEQAAWDGDTWWYSGVHQSLHLAWAVHTQGEQRDNLKAVWRLQLEE